MFVKFWVSVALLKNDGSVIEVVAEKVGKNGYLGFIFLNM